MSDERESTAQELIKLGQLGLETGYWAEAEAYFERALRLVPGHPDALLGRAMACREPRRALDAVRALLAVDPDSEQGRQLEVQLLQELGEPAQDRQARASHGVEDSSRSSGAGRRARGALLGAGALLLLLALLALLLRPQPLLGLFPRQETAASAETALPPPLAALATPGEDAALLAQAFAATVAIRTLDPSGIWMQHGSGVVVDERGLVLTNYHVLADEQGSLLNPDGLAFVGFASDVRQPPDQWYIAAPVALDPTRDLAVLRIVSSGQGRSVQGELFPAIALRQEGDLSLGEALIGLGYPALGGETVTLTRGSMAGFAYTGDDVRLGKTDSELLPGSSGGAVLDAQGRLAGIITASVTEARTQGRLSYFVLVDEAADLIAAARQAPRPSHSLRWMRDLFLAGALGR